MRINQCLLFVLLCMAAFGVGFASWACPGEHNQSVGAKVCRHGSSVIAYVLCIAACVVMMFGLVSNTITL
jgi:hypothetical protein